MSPWLQRVLSSPVGIPSTKRHVVALASIVLCTVTAGLGLACAVRIWRHGDLGSGAVAALSFLAGATAGLAGSAYRKPEAQWLPQSPVTGASAPPAAESAS